jgi:hypothetical protein
MASKLAEHIWTIKELLEIAAGNPNYIFQSRYLSARKRADKLL